MQCELMERVLEILPEVENLISNERAQVQDGLAFVRSDATETSKAAATPHMETFSGSDLSALISIRYAHQSEEEANSVRIARARTGNSDHQTNESEPEQEGN